MSTRASRLVGVVLTRILVLSLTTLLPAAAAAQAVTGTISGTIADQQGQVIPGATVTIVNEATNDARVAVSDERGNFQVTNLQPGLYTVRVALAELPHARTQEHRARAPASGCRSAR